ncbi:protein of unknown function [Methylacidimicrobium sp. AP8]|nr:protein of unknown function [Methylacidimicrobium sp. AP8]
MCLRFTVTTGNAISCFCAPCGCVGRTGARRSMSAWWKATGKRERSSSGLSRLLAARISWHPTWIGSRSCSGGARRLLGERLSLRNPQFGVQRLSPDISGRSWVWKSSWRRRGERQRTVPCGTGVRPCGQPALVPGSEHALAQWLETDYVPDGRGERIRPVWKQNGRVRVDHRFLWPWYRTLDESQGAEGADLGRALCPAAGSLFS